MASVRHQPPSQQDQMSRFSTQISSDDYSSTGHDVGKSSSADYIERLILPLIAETNRSCPTGSLALFVENFLILFQCCVGSFFSFDLSVSMSPTIYVLSQVFFFGLKGRATDVIPFFYLIFGINAVTLIFIVAVLIDIYLNHEFRRWTLYVLRYWHGIFYAIMFIPTITMAFLSFSCLAVDLSVAHVVHVVVALISLAYLYLHQRYLTILLGANPYLAKGSIFFYKIDIITYPITYVGIPIGLCGFFQAFEDWSQYIPRVLMVLTGLYMIYCALEMPFSGILLNAFMSSTGTTVVYGAIQATIMKVIELPRLVSLIPPGVFVVVCFIWAAVFKVIRDKLSLSLRYDAFDGDDDIAKACYFEGLKIRPYVHQQIGLEYHSDLFLDWSLTRHIVNEHPGDNSILLFSAWMCSFFPSEIQVLHSFIMLASKMKEATPLDKAFYYQLHRIHIFRQSSASKEASHDYNKVRNLTNQCIQLYHDFWSNVAAGNEIDVDVFNKIGVAQQQAEASWAEILDKYPNGSRFLTEYSRYLLDGRCMFRESLKWNQKAAAADQGTSQKNDRLFQCFVQSFPDYLKSGYVTTRGELRAFADRQGRMKGQAQSDSTSTFSSSSNSSLSSDDEDENLEDQEMANSIIPQCELRLALERSISVLKSPTIRKVREWDIFILVMVVAFMGLVIGLTIGYLDDLDQMYELLADWNQAAETISLTDAYTCYSWLQKLAHLSLNDYIAALGDTYPNYPKYYSDDKPFRETMHYLVALTKKNIDHAMSKSLAADVSSPRTNEFIKSYAANPVPYFRCSRDAHLQPTPSISAVEELYRIMMFEGDVLAMNDNHNSWPTDPDLCEFYQAQGALMMGMNFSSMAISPAYYLFQTGKEPKEETSFPVTDFIGTLAPFIFIVLLVPPIILLTSGLDKEKKILLEVIQSFPKEESKKASDTLSSGILSTSEKEATIVTDSHRHFFLGWVPYVIHAIIMIAAVIWIISMANADYAKIQIMTDHYIGLGELRNRVYTAGYRDILYVMSKLTTFTSPFLNTALLQPGTYLAIHELNAAYKFLMDGNALMPGMLGFDKRIDKVTIENVCESDTTSTNPIDFFGCLSFSRMLLHFLDQCQKAFSTPPNPLLPQSYLKGTTVLTISNYINQMLALGFRNVTDAYESFEREIVDDYRLYAWCIFGVSLAFSCVLFIIELMFSNVSEKEMQLQMNLLLRINPVAFVSNRKATSLLFGEKDVVAKQKIISAAHAIFQTTPDAMISLNADAVIETVNQATTTIFGYTPEQMLGQSIRFLINESRANNAQLYNSMKLMKSGQTGLVFSQEVIGTKDDGNDVPLRLNLLGFAENGRTADSFAIMCKDQTEEVRQKNMVEGAKAQSEYLLFQILPRDIIVMLNRGDTNISFSVPSATIIFIDIVQFSTYMATLTAMELMTNLGLVFTTFDKLCAEFPLITKIKLIGDIYMAAGGLFTPDGNPEDHANQVLMFALQALASIDRLNIELNANLQVRIGINSGGPLIAGVLGTEKPLFDIIGDPINVSARLQTTDVPGLIQISQGCYDLVAKGPYKIDKRGEIELKGKGKQMTYLVFPDTILAQNPTSATKTEITSIAQMSMNSMQAIQSIALHSESGKL